MRTIKFRGKSLSGEWLYGYLYKHGITPPSNFLCICQAVLPWKDTVGVYVVDPETIGQFTGLYDKNGKVIYEGDVIMINLTDGSTTVSSVVWNRRGYWGCDIDINHGVQLGLIDKVRIEVVGNIHDNPELREEG